MFANGFGYDFVAEKSVYTHRPRVAIALAEAQALRRREDFSVK